MTAALQIPVLEELNFELRDVTHQFLFEPTAKRVRTFLGDVAVADSTRVMILTETGRLPVYYFPVEDVRGDLLVPGGRQYTSKRKGVAAYMSVVVGARRAENGAWRYAANPPTGPDLSGHIAFHWKLMDAWYEEDDEVFFHARDPHHRIDVLNSSRRVQVFAGDTLLADTRHARMLYETNLPTRYYIPREDVRLEALAASATATGCPYKGLATEYWSTADGAISDVAWSYPEPLPEVGGIAGRVCFFNERCEIVVDGVRQPKPTSPWT
ncbi:MAG: DUF427 domain-containing protein [Candidatus Dormibacteria bacterium]